MSIQKYKQFIAFIVLGLAISAFACEGTTYIVDFPDPDGGTCGDGGGGQGGQGGQGGCAP